MPKKIRRVNYLGNGRIEEGEWYALKRLGKTRGFRHLTGRRVDGNWFKVLGGITNDQVHGLLGEIRQGGWTHTPTSRKRHFFKKRGEIFGNPSLCGKHNLTFYTNLDHDDNDSDKCVICLRKFNAFPIKQVEVHSGS